MPPSTGDPEVGGHRPLTGADVDAYLMHQRQKSEPNYLSDLAPAIARVREVAPGARAMCIRVGCTQGDGVQRHFFTSGEQHGSMPGHRVIPIYPTKRTNAQ